MFFKAQVFFGFIFPYVLFVLHHDHKQYGVAKWQCLQNLCIRLCVLIEFVYQALAMMPWAVESHTGSKEEDDIKEHED